jgi:hypothetical protein
VGLVIDVYAHAATSRIVIPAKAGIHVERVVRRTQVKNVVSFGRIPNWIPAFAGMTSGRP